VENNKKPNSPSERLLKGKGQEEREKFTRSYSRAKTVLNEINKYATQQVVHMSKNMDSPQNFETPNWQYLNAWQSGYRHAMRVTQDLTRT
jgi:hypothetical protein